MKRIFTKMLTASLFGLSLVALPAFAGESGSTTTHGPGPSLSDDQIVGRVEQINTVDRTFTVETNRGNQDVLWASYGTQIVKDGSSVSFEGLKVGDQVAIRYPNNAPNMAWEIQASSTSCGAVASCSGESLPSP